MKQLNPERHVITAAMKRGIDMESHASMVYAQNARKNGVNLFPSGIILHPKCPWLGCSPDRKVYDLEVAHNGQNPFGLLEIKVVQEGTDNFDKVQYLQRDADSGVFHLKQNHIYFLQIQCQLGLTGLDWCDFFSYINDNTFFSERIIFNKTVFQEAKDKVDKFFFNYYLQ